MRKLAFCAVLFLASVSFAPAHAAQIINTNLGDVTAPSSSTTTYSADSFISAFYYGSLPSMSKVVFSYSLSPAADGFMAGLTSVGYEVGPNGSSAKAEVLVGAPKAITTDDLIVATADLPTYASGSTSITNYGKTAIAFQSLLTAWLNKAVALTVAVDVSAVPLPAALPLFGLGLASLVGFRARKKKAGVA